MILHRVTASARIPAAPKRVYAILADYRHGQPYILTGQPTDLTIERGGTGAGTIVGFRMRVAGRVRAFRAAVTEPEPGRVLAETNLEGRVAVTTFTIVPTENGRASEVTLSTAVVLRDGIVGTIERLVITRVVRSLHEERLKRLEAIIAIPS